MTKTAPVTQVLACPSCGSTNLTFGWAAVVTMHVNEGVVEDVELGGVFGVQPDHFGCDGCGHWSADTATGISSSGRVVLDALPALAEEAQRLALTIHTDDGWTVYENPEAARV